MSRVWLGRTLGVLAVVSCLGLAAATAAALYLRAPGGGTPAIDIVIPPRSSLTAISVILNDRGVVGNPHLFYLAARLAPVLAKVYRRPLVDPNLVLPGTYRLSGGLSPIQVLSALRAPLRQSGVRITIPDGATVWDVALMLESRHIAAASDVRRRAFDAAVASRLVGWATPTLEGYLFPDTYMVEPGASVDLVLEKFVGRFHQKWRARYSDGVARTGLTPHQFVTLASIIEKEAGAGEYARVSTVFQNRLRRGWHLEACSTAIYGLLPAFHGRLHDGDLENPQPYNTYVHNGLPPGPISSPGDRALSSVLQPSGGCWMFFVSKNDGTNAFSCTRDQHWTFIERYQLH